jgi:hypothetical protein
MDAVLMEIGISLVRAAVATFFAKELFPITIPTLVVFCIMTYALLTRDPLRSSLPPHIGLTGAWNVLCGQRRPDGDTREFVRLSVFGRDVFWLSNEDILNDLAASGQLVPIFHGKGSIITYGDKDIMALEKVFLLVLD